MWLDEDRNGLQDPGEPGIADVTVRLLNGYGVSVSGTETLTAIDGTYSFSGLPDGEYRIAFARPEGRAFTKTAVGGRDPSGRRVTDTSRPDDSDLNLRNGLLEPARRGPHETGMTSAELTRIDASGNPWPVNTWIVYPAAAGSSSGLPKASVLELYGGDAVDISNNVATAKLAVSTILGLSANLVSSADPAGVLQDVEARLDVPVLQGGPFPVALLVPGLIGGVADMVEIADHLASHGYVSICIESTAFHSSIALGGRLTRNGGTWETSDFDHVPQIAGGVMTTLANFGYDSDGYLVGNYQASANQQRLSLANDSRFTLDQAEEWNTTAGHRFEGVLDLSRVGWVGFSAGARSALNGVRFDRRVDMLINIDSAFFTNVPKPMLWIGNQNGSTPNGPSIMAGLLNDFHGHYADIPAIRFTPPTSTVTFHREYHHTFRNTLMTAYLGLWLKDALAYRDVLGLNGIDPSFDGYVAPYTKRKFLGWHSAPFRLADGDRHDIDAGLVQQSLWVVDGTQLSTLDTAFLADGSVSATHRTDHGGLRVAAGSGSVPLGETVDALAVGANGVGWFVAGIPQRLFAFDTRIVEAGATPLAVDAGMISGLSTPLSALAIEPRSGQLFGHSSDGLHTIHLAAGGPLASSPTATSLPSASGLVFGPRDEPWIADGSTGLMRISSASGQALETIATPGLVPDSAAFDFISSRIVLLDASNSTLSIVDPEEGTVEDYGDLSALGFGTALAIAAPAPVAAGFLPTLSGTSPDSSGGATPLPVLEEPRLSDALEDWNDAVLHVQIVEGSGSPGSDVLTLESLGGVTLGAVVPVELPIHAIGEAQEVFWNGTLVGWLETDWDLGRGGSNLAPLRIVFTGDADAPAVEAVIEAVRYAGPLPRRIELRLEGADAGSGTRHVLDL